MPLIKRYPNRKLYDTEAKRYITLEDIAVLIRRGESIQVIDHDRMEDITAQTLSQVILELEKKPGGFLPTSLLSDLIQVGNRRPLSGMLPVFSGFASCVDQAIRQRLERLVREGELSPESAETLAEKLIPDDPRVFGLESPLVRILERMFREGKLVHKADLKVLTSQVEALAEKIDALS